MRKSNPILHFERLDLLGIAIALSILSFQEYIVLIVLTCYLFYVRKHLCWMLFFMLNLLAFVTYQTLDQQKVPKTINGYGEVINKDSYDSYDKLIVKIDKFKYIAYAQHNQFRLGDQIDVQGIIEKYPHQTAPLGFDYHRYYQSNGISGKMIWDEVRLVKHTHHIYSLREKLLNLLENKNLSPYIKLIFFGVPLDDDTEAVYNLMGLSFVLSVSGLHLYVFVQFIKKMLFYMDMPMPHQSLIVLTLYGVMAYLHRFDLGVTRLLIIALLSHFNHYYEWRKSRLELIQIAFFILLITKPSYIFSLSFLIVYFIVNLLNLCEPLYRGHRGFYRRMIIGSLVFIILVPFQTSVNLYQIIWTPFLALYLIGFLMIGSFVVICFPLCNAIFNQATHYMHSVMQFLSEQSLSITYGKMDHYQVVLYFTLLILLLISRKTVKRLIIVLLIVSLLIIPNAIKNQMTSITFLDVGQGDSTIMQSEGCVVVVDAFKGARSHLKNQGITKIDYLFLTHSDTDHILEAESLITQMKVNQLIFSSSDDGYPHYGIKSKRVRAGDAFTCGSIKIEVLAPLEDEDNANNASIVLQTKLGDKTFLLTGDISYETELKLVSVYQEKIRSDVLKIAHHGSNSSTHEAFLHYVKPKVVIISVGRSNRYGFPHDEVIKRLKDLHILIYRTDIHGSIVYTPSKKKSKWEMYLPF